MSASKLIKPAPAFKDSFLDAMREFQAEHRFENIDLDYATEDFERFSENLHTGKRSLYDPLPDWAERVPETLFWFVKDETFLGFFAVRHRLNWHLEKWGGHISFAIRPSWRGKGYGKKILQKGIPYTCHLGIDRALITVDPLNKAAIHVLESCGAEFEDETAATGKFPVQRRYWLRCN